MSVTAPLTMESALSELGKLRKVAIDYLSEHDNPVPDYNLRRSLRNQLREMVGAPPEPPPRGRFR